MEQASIIKTQNNILIIFLTMIFVLFLVIFVSFSVLNDYKYVRLCRSFSTQKDAQNALKKYPGLDNNHDGIACNELIR